jgi:hypothetical protein
VQVPRCSWQSKALDEVPYKLSGAVTKLASITLVWLLPVRIYKPWFLGVPNWMVIYINRATTSTTLVHLWHRPFTYIVSPKT